MGKTPDPKELAVGAWSAKVDFRVGASDSDVLAVLAGLPPRTRSSYIRRVIRAGARMGLHTEESLRADLHRVHEARADLDAREAVLDMQLRELIQGRERRTAWREDLVQRVRTVQTSQARHRLWAKSRGIPDDIVAEVLS